MTNFVKHMMNTIKENGMIGQEKEAYIERKTNEIKEKMAIVQDDKELMEVLESILEDIENTFTNDVAAKLWNEAVDNKKAKKLGGYSYEYIKTGLKEITFLTNHRETSVTVIIDKNMNIKRIATSGKGSRSKTDKLKMLGQEEYSDLLNGCSKAKKDMNGVYYVKSI